MRRAVFLSVSLLLACSSSRASSPAPTKTASDESPGSPRALLEPGDFRSRFVDVAKKVRPAVVTITAIQEVEVGASPFGQGSPFDFFFRHPGMRPPQGGPQKREQGGIGSGVIIDGKGTILTNNHVVADATELKVVLSNDRELKAKLVGTDPKTDVAVIRIEESELKGVELSPARLGTSSNLEVGEWVMAIGAPFGLKQTVSAGIISALGRGHVGITDYEDFIQTDAAINPGNSGGPLVNLEGEVIGINTAIASRSGGNQGVGFAIPVEMVRRVMEQLVAHGSVTRGYIGLMIADLTPELAESFAFAGRDGVLVQDVERGGPGEKAGLRAGDIVFARDGQKVDDVAVFRNGIAAAAPGTSVALDVWRDGKATKITLKLGKLEGERSASADTGAEGGRPGWGLALSDLTPDARRQLNTGDVQGALIGEVVPGSSAERAGLRAGDVLISVGSEAVVSAAQAAERLKAAPKDKPLRLRIVREGRGTFVIVPPVSE